MKLPAAAYLAIIGALPTVMGKPIDTTPITVGVSSTIYNGTEIEADNSANRVDYVNVYMCYHANFQGTCWNWNSPLDFSCRTFASDVFNSWNDQVSSLTMVSNAICVFYEHGGCSGRSYQTKYDNDLADGGGAFNDAITSWKCRYD